VVRGNGVGQRVWGQGNQGDWRGGRGIVA